MAYVAKTKKRVYYKNVVVVEQAVAGTYPFTPSKDVLFEGYLSGAGAGAAFNSSSNRSSAAAGGSGSGCILRAVLKAGQTYNAVVGKGGVAIGELDATATGGRGGNTFIEVINGAILATAEGGIGGNVWWPNGQSQGAPAPLPTVNTADANIEFQKWIFSKQGIPGAIGGNPSAGGPSVFDGTTYGQGGQAWNAGGGSRGEAGKDGYIKIIYKEVVQEGEEYDDYEDIVQLHLAKTKKRVTKPNYSIVGNPTVDNGVVSGFSQSNFITLPDLFSPGTNLWEIVIKGNFTDFSSAQGVFISVASSATAASSSIGTISAYGLQIHVRNGKVALYLSSTGNSWNLANLLQGITSLVTGTDYWIKLVFTGNEYILYLSTTGAFAGEETVEVTVTTTTAIYPRYFLIGCNGSGINEPVMGSVDLNETQVKINNEIWWSKDKFVDEVTCYAAKRKVRKYYKYTFSPWVQPVLTSDTSYGTVSAIGYREGQTQPFKALDGVKSGTPQTMQGWVSNTNTVGAWWMWKVPVKLKINSIKFYNQHSGNNNNIFTAQFFADQAGTIPLSNPFTTLAGAYSVVDSPSIYDGITDCIYFKCLSIASNNVGIGELEISADYVTGSEEVSASDDWDYYVDTEL